MENDKCNEILRSKFDIFELFDLFLILVIMQNYFGSIFPYFCISNIPENTLSKRKVIFQIHFVLPIPYLQTKLGFFQLLPPVEIKLPKTVNLVGRS